MFDSAPEDEGGGGPDRRGSYVAGQQFGMEVAEGVLEQAEAMGDAVCLHSVMSGLLRTLIGFWAADQTDADVETGLQQIVDDAMRDRAEFHSAHPEADPNAQDET